MPLSIEHKIGGGFSIVLLLLIVVCVTSYLSIQRLTADAALVERTQRVNTLLESLLSLQADLQTSTLSYVIAGDDRFLQSFQEAIPQSALEYATLHDLITDPAQKRRLEALAPLLAARTADNLALVELRRTQGFPAAQHAIATGPQPHQRIGDAIAEMQTAENALLLERKTRALSSASRTKSIIVAGSALAFLSVALSLSLILRDITARKRAEEALRHSENRFRRIMESDMIGLLFWNTTGGVTTANDAFLRIVGYTQDDVRTGRLDWRHLTPPEQLARDEAAILEATTHGSCLPYEKEYIHKNGTLVPILIGGATFPEQPGTGVAFVLDITERKQAEQRIRQLNRTYSVLSDINQLIVRERDPQAILTAACRIAVDRGGFQLAWIGLADEPTTPFQIRAHAGASPATLSLIGELLHDPSRGCAFTAHCLATGTHAICNAIATDPHAAPWRTDAIERGYQSMGAFPLTVHGRCIGTFNLYAGLADFFDADELRLLDELAQDIAFALEGCERERQRTRAIDELHASEIRFRQIADHIHEVFWLSNSLTQQILYVSPAYETIWGRTCASLCAGSPGWIDTIHPEDRARIELATTRTRRAERPFDEICRIVRPDATIRWIHARAIPIKNPAGAVTQIVGTAEDITESRELEQQLRQSQKLEAIGTLAGGIAHDFNNILSGITGFTSLAREHAKDDPEFIDYLDEIGRASRRATELVRQILAFSRAGDETLIPVQLRHVVAEATQLLRAAIPSTIAFETHLSAGLPTVQGNATQLHQIVMNLGTNAWHAMRDRPGRLTIRLETCLVDAPLAHTLPGIDPGPFVRLTITDTGCGMDPATQEHVFEPFFTTKAPGEGTGLGLSVVHGIVTGHHGAIRLTSMIDHGTTFEIYLPAIATTPSETLPETGELPRGHGEHILFVDDEAPLARLGERTLRQLGYTATAESNPLDALARLIREPRAFDLVICDQTMPGLTGLEFAARIRALRPDLPVVLTSGYATGLPPGRIAASGVREVLAKPYTIAMLAAAAHRHIRPRPPAHTTPQLPPSA